MTLPHQSMIQHLHCLPSLPIFKPTTQVFQVMSRSYILYITPQKQNHLSNNPNPQISKLLPFTPHHFIITSPSKKSPSNIIYLYTTQHNLLLPQSKKMCHMSYNYNRVSSGRGGCRGFRLNLRRIYFLRLRKRFRFFIRLFDMLKLSHAQAVHVLKRIFCRKSGFKRNNSNSSRSGLFMRDERIKGHQVDSRVSSFERNNTFNAEAIADCLEFIKRTSISSVDQIQESIGHIQDRNS